ncbi:MAG: tetratricopeptide repeat protein [Kouleothrix sp.]|nr:tetratricopeptide repeat protein [Kouleothrix sp.]
MPSLYLIALLVMALFVLALLPPVRQFVASQLARLRGRAAPARPRASTGVTLIAGDGEEYELPVEEEPSDWARWRASLGSGPQLAARALVALLALAAIVQLYRVLLAPAPDQFVVLVAPFYEPGGAVTQTGREVAAALTAELPSASGGQVVARSLSEPPADADAALATLSREGADALIWGEVAPGGMVDRESLQPLLVYQPNGAFAPYGWDGYAGRFELPSAYALAAGPINGQAVLPALMDALADYGAGRVDSAFDTLGRLLNDYPALAPALPRALRGNVLWARGAFPEAAAEYRRALASLASDAGRQAAPLYNNLGAILLDAGDAEARNAFNQSVAALGGRDLSALRYNLGLQALRAGSYDDAVTALDVARSPSLLPPTQPSAALLLALADADRLAGRFSEAHSALDTAILQTPASASATIPELVSLTRDRLDAAVEAERALLILSETAGAHGSLLWEAQHKAPLPIGTLNTVRTDLKQTVDDTQVLAQRWARLSVAKDAANEAAAGQIATNHVLRARELLRDRQRWLAGVDIERERAQGIQEPRGLGAIWAMIAGDYSPMGQARKTLEGLVASRPSDVDSLLLLGRSWLLSGDTAKAGEQFDRAAAASPQRPEPVYGQALVALPDDRARARQLLSRAITLNPAYFPAREMLATIAEEDKDWPTAIEQRRWLLDNRPNNEYKGHALALAETLRASGESGFAAAEQLLLPLARQNDIDALLALSRLYAEHGDSQGARDVLARAKQIDPSNPEPSFQLAGLLEQQGRLDDAEAEYQHAITVSPSHIPSRLALGALYTRRRELAKASQQYSAALEAGAQDPAALKQIGNVLLENGEYEAAADAYSRAIKVDNGDAELYHGLAQAELQRSRLDAAETAELRALELRASYPQAMVGLGDIALTRNNPDVATQQYNAALKIDSRLVQAQIGLGRAAGAVGNWAVAEARFRDAVGVAPDMAEAHLWLGEALVRKPDPKAAIDEYALALARKPNYPAAYFGLAQAQMAIGQTDLAQTNLTSALKLNPSYSEALLLQGKLYEQLGNDDAAIKAYGQSIGVSGTLAEPYYRRALVYMRTEHLDEAASDLEKAIKIQPNFAEAHYWLGRAYLAQGRPKPALEQFVLANDQHSGPYPDARFYQGLAEEQLGLRTDAVASYQAALDENTNGEWAGEARTAIDRLK